MQTADVMRYNRVAAALHWIIAILVVAQIYIGWTFADMPRGTPAKGEWFLWHKTIGVLILLITLGRLGWRIANPPPPFPAAMAAWEKMAARANHLLFYAILIILPLSGWIMISAGAADATTSLLGGLPWPLVPGLAKGAHEPAEFIHKFLVLTTLLLVAIHIAAALKHQFSRDPGVSGRMPPFRPRGD